MRPCQLFVWSADHGNHLDIQLNVRLWTQALYHRATIKLIRHHFMLKESMDHRLCLHGEAVLRDNCSVNCRLLPIFTIQGYMAHVRNRSIISDWILAYAFHFPTFPHLSDIFHKTLIKFLLQSVNPKNLLPTFEQGTRIRMG
ncbi:hypothetical protein D3C76_909970 [compost metagenome]